MIVAARIGGAVALALALVACGGGGGSAGGPPVPVVSTPPSAGTDVVVYGATPSGIAAALAAARHGKIVTLLEPGSHVGGMPASGLGSSDLYDTTQIGGIAKEFFLDVGSAYKKTTPVYAFEPHVAEAVFAGMIAGAGSVHLVAGAQMLGAAKSMAQVTSVTTTAGMFAAREFIDASYEGDLLAAAGVATTVGRESNARYNERHNGATAGDLPGGKVISPYITPSDPTSGLIPHVSAGPLTAQGAGDALVQAYNYRLCLTQVGTNALPVPVPAGYDPAEFELVARESEALTAAGSPPTLGTFLLFAPLPAYKWDVNNSGFASTDEVGANAQYPLGSIASRQQADAELQRYTLAFLTFLRTSTRLPVAVNAAMASYGLCADEFAGNQNLPYRSYVREARRMVGAYVVTEADLSGTATIPDSVGRGGYPQDSHYVERSHRVTGGADAVVGEGDVSNSLGHTYPISYRALTPAATDATNVLGTVCVSASHAAFLSVRVEATLMILGQAGGTAASLAIDQGVPVQSVSYTRLASALAADGQVL